jgi:hypothetical protein
MTFVPEVFPSTFSVLYCPLEGCKEEMPFCDPKGLLFHLESCHKITVHNPEVVVSIFDRYMKAIALRIEIEPSISQIGGPEDTADQDLRHRLQTERLQDILDKQQRERELYFKVPGVCLFCPEVSTDKYSLLSHMYREHFFNIGQLDNLVMVEEFLQLLRVKIEQNECIYCEKQFPDKIILKKHMRCKGHYKINSHNNTYDRFYIVNYMLPGATWHDLAADLADLNVDSMEEDGDWEGLDEPVDMKTACLLCEHQESDPELILKHMEDSHSFKLCSCFSEFYDGIKIVNFMRISWRDCRCAFCSETFGDSDSLCAHFESCSSKREGKVNAEWKNSEFLFPFYEDDNLLSILE